MSRIVLAGYGDLNSRVAARALLQGDEVVALRRQVVMDKNQVTQVAIDLSDQLWPDYRADYLVVALSAQTRSLEGYQQAYVAPLEQLIKSLPHWQALPKKIIVVSSSRVFGEHQGEWLVDESPANSDDAYANILLQMEERLHLIKTVTCAATLSGIYSAQRDWLKRQALKPASDLSKSNHWTNRIHIEDAASALMHLVNLNTALPSRVLVTDQQPMTHYDVMEYLRQAEGWPAIDQVPEIQGGKRLRPQFLEETGFTWQFPNATSGGYAHP